MLAGKECKFSFTEAVVCFLVFSCSSADCDPCVQVELMVFITQSSLSLSLSLSLVLDTLHLQAAINV